MAAALGLLVAATLSFQVPAAPRDSARSAALRQTAIEHLLQLGEDSALALYRAARAADPDNLNVQYEYLMLMRGHLEWPRVSRELADASNRGRWQACLQAAVSEQASARPPPRLLALESAGPSTCTDLFLMGTLERSTRAARGAPSLGAAWSALSQQLAAAGRPGEASAALGTGLRRTDNPLTRQQLLISLVRLRLQTGDTSGARALWRTFEQAMRGESRPGLRAAYYQVLCADRGSLPPPAALTREAACDSLGTLALRARGTMQRATLLRSVALAHADFGRNSSALPFLNRLAADAARSGLAGHRLLTLGSRGRIFAKMGRSTEAIADLREAIAAGAAAQAPWFLAEAWHDLAHAYESAGRFADAASAVDTFIVLAAAMQSPSQQMMSRHDAGMIRWSAGWHAAANRDFAEMLRIVDAEGVGHYFAGEYYERHGDLERALRHYRAGAEPSSGVAVTDTRNLTALARLYEALGLPDSAADAARRHDARPGQWMLLEGPLLPLLLQRQGRTAEAIDLAVSWARDREQAGDRQGAAVSWRRSAELMLEAGTPARAVDAATRARDLASGVHFVAELSSARRLLGKSLIAVGDTALGIAALERALAEARAHPDADDLVAAQLALGNARRWTGRPREALALYGLAASALERTNRSIGSDDLRTGFRSRHLAPYDAALGILLFGATPDAAGAVRWSARRKGAALAAVGVASRRPIDLTLASLQSRLGADEAIIDYTVLDSAIATIVVRRHTASIVALPERIGRISGWIRAARPSPAANSARLDLAHSGYDAAAAANLHLALMAPLARHLEGVRALTVIPDGVLWYVAFAALPASPDRYLIDRYEVRVAPSAQFVSDRSVSAPRPRFRVTAVMLDVPGGAAELAGIRAALGDDRVLVRSGASATEAATLGATTEVLHLAAHNLIDDRDPLATHLQLSPDGRDDGLLHLPEISARSRVPRLVVLAACEAASGALYGGEGLVGMARAFLLGGARSVVASGWPVLETSSVLMREFYGRLAEGLSPAAALRQAQLRLRSQPATSHPLHWGGFVVIGG